MKFKKISKLGILSLGLFLLFTNMGFTATKHHRVVWDSDPSTKAVIGFSPSGQSSSPYIKYGTSSDDSQWSNASVSYTRRFDNSLTSHFVRLSGLTPNSAIYYKVCDSSGCGQKFWFRTAPNDESPYTVVAGGDTRTGWTNRRNGNKLIAKIRPLFIMHGGDFTDSNNASQMNAYLDDWAYTYSSDTINGVSFKRIYPFIPTHGNHEDDNYSTLCEVFGVDYNSDNQCSSTDTYSAFNISPLLRVYTLNSQFKNSGWSSQATAMNNWFKSDVQNKGSTAQWRVAQYHKPIFPHYSGKSENDILFDWWSSTFYDGAMNLVVESDTHITKVTKVVKPSGNNFVTNEAGGTIFVGEGSWGAPARSADDGKSWTLAMGAIQQFKVITVKKENLDVRTAQFNSGASTLTKAQRDADPTLLPSNVSWWAQGNLGEKMVVGQNSQGQSIIDDGSTVPPTDDVVLTNGQSVVASDNNTYRLDVPNGASNLNFTISGGSGDADLYVKFGSLPTTDSYDCRPYKSGNNESCPISNAQEGTYYVVVKAYAAYSNVALKGSYTTDGTPPPSDNALSNNTPITALDSKVYTFDVPSGATNLSIKISGGTGDADLYVKFGSEPSTSVYDCRPYRSGNEETCDISNVQTGKYYIKVVAYEPYSNVSLLGSYKDGDSTPPGNDPINETFSPISVSGEQWKHYTQEISANYSELIVTMSGGQGDADLYVRHGAESTSSQYDCRPYKDGNEEVCTLSNPAQGIWYIDLYGYNSASGVTLNIKANP